MSRIEQIISEQVLAWSKREAEYKKQTKSLEIWPIITISRQFGAKGNSLAEALSNRCGFKVWDKNLLSAISDEAGADEKLLASLDERRRKTINDALYGFLLGYKHSNTHYFRSLLRVVKTIGAHGKSIIVGRGGNYILKPSESLRIRLVCDLEKRVSNIIEREGVTEDKARKMIQAIDGERNDFITHHFKQDAEDSLHYDLVINTGIFDTQQMVDLIMLAYEKKVGKPLPHKL